jgi:hypothetical protein
MKTQIVLYTDPGKRYSREKVFGGKSAYERSLEWATAFSKTAVIICC